MLASIGPTSARHQMCAELGWNTRGQWSHDLDDTSSSSHTGRHFVKKKSTHSLFARISPSCGRVQYHLYFEVEFLLLRKYGMIKLACFLRHGWKLTALLAYSWYNNHHYIIASPHDVILSLMTSRCYGNDLVARPCGIDTTRAVNNIFSSLLIFRLKGEKKVRGPTCGWYPMTEYKMFIKSILRRPEHGYSLQF